jgi:hypothetical protein
MRSSCPEGMPGRRTVIYSSARHRVTLDSRQHEGSVAIFRGDGVHRGDLRVIVAIERCSACRASLAGHTSSERSIHRILRSYCHRGFQALQCTGNLDTRSDARRKQITSAIAKGRHGADADHVKDLRRNYALATVSAPTSIIRTTISWPLPLAFASSMIVTARRTFSLPTMPGLGVTNIIRRRVVRCRMRRRRMSQRSRD